MIVVSRTRKSIGVVDFRRMSDKPRRFWQMHLSTAIVMMVVTAACIGLNLQRDGINKYSQGDQEPFGFPWTFLYIERGALDRSNIPINCHWLATDIDLHLMQSEGLWALSVTRLLGNVLALAGSVAIIGGTTEYLIRRRSKP